MKKKIKYEMDKETFQCFTKCEHFNGVKVGSNWCTINCTHFISDDEQYHTVTCNHPNNKPDKEDGNNELQ